ncbi:hypothetical protein GYMLUDRAFT_59408 [Collybiopsis luxurians FD-317 M1]|uniref:Uncharacterized protein n=1 Tax=Collybiopsis luxurians FD-317 M1 TaxID=944289 RepID=A0A0D0BAG5_9AGAR|nr:hypothetical protein GYMLUDRAFT_59408 [Collybiopsis luxurians FD-317 M1]
MNRHEHNPADFHCIFGNAGAPLSENSVNSRHLLAFTHDENLLVELFQTHTHKVIHVLCWHEAVPPTIPAEPRSITPIYDSDHPDYNASDESKSIHANSSIDGSSDTTSSSHSKDSQVDKLDSDLDSGLDVVALIDLTAEDTDAVIDLTREDIDIDM